MLRQLLLLISLCSLTVIGLAQCDRTQDSMALLKIWNENGGQNWSTNGLYNSYETSFGAESIANAGKPWDPYTSIDSWHGIRTNDEGCVSTILLPNLNLTGDISNFDFDHLEMLG